MQTSIILSLILTLFGCENGAGFPQASNNIKEAKARGVFICEYKGLTNPVKINDSLKITIKEAWIEQHWTYSQNSGQTIAIDGYQICINSVESDLKNVDFDWTIGINGDFYLRSSGKNSLIGDFINMPEGDTLTYLVQKGDNLSDVSNKIIIGKFEIINTNTAQ